jgi:hypothetical protein
VEVEALQEFARRRRDLVERLKAEFWSEEKRRLTPVEALAVADGLRRHTASIRPEWPSDRERARDLRSHQELSRKLALARPTCGR